MRLSDRIRMARAVRRAHPRCLICRFLRSCWEEMVKEVTDHGP